MRTGNAVLNMILDDLVEAVAERVAAKLVAGASSHGEVVYTTHKNGPHIPGKSRDWMRRKVKTMPGSRKVGRDWVIGRAEYERWASAHDGARIRSASPVKPIVDDVDWADAMLAANGLRGQRLAQ